VTVGSIRTRFSTTSAITDRQVPCTQGGGAIANLADGDIPSIVVMDACELTTNVAGIKGGAIYNVARMVMTTCKLTANTAPQGASLSLHDGSSTTYVLPAPPGYWLSATTCEVWRKACVTAACNNARDECAMNPTDNAVCGEDTGSVCQPILSIQPCDWQANPALLGSTAFVLPLGARNDDLPYACAPGVLGGNGSLVSEQTSAICAGLCPAGFTCGEASTVAPAICPKAHFCPEGTSVAQLCQQGTYSNATGLHSAAACTPTDAGHYATAGSTQPAPCVVGTAQPSMGMGSCVKCGTGTFQDKEGRSSCSICGAGSYSANVLSCEVCQVGEFCLEGSVVGTPCPIGSTTEGRGAKSSNECGCPVGTYAAAGDELSCTPCSDNMLCTRTSLTLAAVPLPISRWRHSNRTAAIETCNTVGNISACLGGVDSTNYCADGHRGPRCEWCVDSDYYYDKTTASCKECGDVAQYALQQGVILLGIIVWLALLHVALQRAPRLLSQFSSRLNQLLIACKQFGLQAKFKIVLQFVQVWMVRESVYGVVFPGEFSSWLSVFELLSFDVGGFLFPSWSCIGDLGVRIAFNGSWPLVLMLVVASVIMMRAAVRRSSAFKALLLALEAAIFISFCVLPSVTRSLFLAFQCESFGWDDMQANTRAYLTSSLDVECSTEGHASIRNLALFFICVWPVGMTLLYVGLLWGCRRAVREHKPNTLSRATSFLWKEYDDRYFWWELVELSKKLVLTNVLLVIDTEEGSAKLVRLFVAFLVSLIGLTLTLFTQPFKRHSDNHLNIVAQLILVIFFVTGILIKLCDEDAANLMYNSCHNLVGFGSGYHVTLIMLCAGFVVILLPFGMFTRQLLVAQSVPIMQLASSKEPPSLVLSKELRYHLFLSHIWSTGQDQCAIIKRQLQLLLPGVAVFLDVDDLQDIGDLEGYVHESAVVLFFLSRRYFQSRNCLREIVASLEQQKPLVLVHEQQQEKGGGPLDLLKSECPKERRALIFDGRTPITWHRIKDYQNLTLKLIATEMLCHSPVYRTVGAKAQAEDATKPGLGLTIPGETDVSELVLPGSLVIWCSPGNPGAKSVVQELAAALGGSASPIRVVGSQPDAAAGESAVMVVYLNKQTWVKPVEREALARDLRVARKVTFGASADTSSRRAHIRRLNAINLTKTLESASRVLKVVLVHENDPLRGGCEFGDFFASTPQGEAVDSNSKPAVILIC
jgi:hypothetical protein